jgi:flagellar export protein FliJ
MKKFCFTLEAVRTLRRRQEHLAVDEYVRALLGRQKAMDAVLDLQRQLENNRMELARVLSSGCTAAQAFQLGNYHRFLEKQREQHLSALAAAEHHLAGVFQAMLMARQQREIVEVYRKKQQARHQRDLLREDQKAVDESAARNGASVLSWSHTKETA